MATWRASFQSLLVGLEFDDLAGLPDAKRVEIADLRAGWWGWPLAVEPAPELAAAVAPIIDRGHRRGAVAAGAVSGDSAAVSPACRAASGCDVAPSSS